MKIVKSKVSSLFEWVINIISQIYWNSKLINIVFLLDNSSDNFQFVICAFNSLIHLKTSNPSKSNNGVKAFQSFELYFAESAIIPVGWYQKVLKTNSLEKSA